MAVVGIHASHEQIDPTALLVAVQWAEQAGFTGAMCSDHVSPWSERQGHSGFAWAWLGAALQATSLPFAFLRSHRSKSRVGSSCCRIRTRSPATVKISIFADWGRLTKWS